MLEKVRKYMELYHMIDRGDRIVMGVSGGADSVALFLLMNALKQEYDLQLFVVHVNHGIREDAGEDETYVKRICESYQVPCYVFIADIPSMARENGISEEEMGRVYRYEQFMKVMAKEQANKLAVAHHMDDQAETLLFHLVRGTDLAGMAGMRPVSDLVWNTPEARHTDDWMSEKKSNEEDMAYAGVALTEKKLIRPLLGCRKEELVRWLDEQNLNWREDYTNQDNRYTRNKLRNLVVPQLEEINAEAVGHIAGFANQALEYEEFFQSIVQEYRKEHVKNSDFCCETGKEELLKQKKILSEAVLYEMITDVCGAKKNITREHVGAVYDLLEKQSGKRIDLPYETEAYLSYDRLMIRKKKESTKQQAEQMDGVCAGIGMWERDDAIDLLLSGEGYQSKQSFTLPQGGRLIFSLRDMDRMGEKTKREILINARNSKNIYTKYFNCDTIKDTLCVRYPQKNDTIALGENGMRKKVSRYFMDRKIPAEERKNRIIVARGNEVLWIPGERRCETYRIYEDTKYVLELTYEGEENELPY